MLITRLVKRAASERITTRDDARQERDNGQRQKYVDVPPDGVDPNDAKEPEYEKQHADSDKHSGICYWLTSPGRPCAIRQRDTSTVARGVEDEVEDGAPNIEGLVAT